MNRDLFFQRIGYAASELRAAELALGQLRQRVLADPTPLRKHRVKPSDVARSLGNVEGTYIVRLFAEFETAIKTYWMRANKQRAWPRTNVSTLMNRLAARLHVDADCLVGAHEVRQCRNVLVHQQPTGPILSITECRSRLGRFLHFLPHVW